MEIRNFSSEFPCRNLPMPYSSARFLNDVTYEMMSNTFPTGQDLSSILFGKTNGGNDYSFGITASVPPQSFRTTGHKKKNLEHW